VIRRLAQALLVVAALALLAFTWRCDAPWFERHVFLPQQFFIIASRRIVFASRAAAAGMATLLLFMVPLLPRRAALQRLVGAVLLAFVAAEGFLQWRLRRLVNPGLADAMETLTTEHPRYGRTLAAGLDRLHGMSGRQIRFRTDSERRRISGTTVDPALPSLIFTGESTVAGVGLEWEETFPAIVAARLHLQVVNVASPAYRLDQSWLRLKDTLPALEHPVAVVGLFVPGLLARSFGGQQHPRARTSADGSVELLRQEPAGFLQRLALYRLWKHVYWSDTAFEEAMQSASAVLRDMAALSKARGASCIFVVSGRTPQWMARKLFDAKGLEYVVIDVPETELLADGHPGPHGSVRIADELEARLRTRMANR
jgi:hypothetical protein